MPNDCIRCRQPRPSIDDHELCAQCKMAAGMCHVDASNPISVCEAVCVKTWDKLRRSLSDARLRAIQRERPHWTTAFPQIEAWIANRPASAAGSYEPGSEINSIADSGDVFSVHNHIIGTKGSVYGDS